MVNCNSVSQMQTRFVRPEFSYNASGFVPGHDFGVGCQTEYRAVPLLRIGPVVHMEIAPAKTC
jgi:hypothetical protein